MSATINQIMIAKRDEGLRRRAVAAAEQLGIDMAENQVGSNWGKIVSTEVSDGGSGTTSIAYALDYHLSDIQNAVASLDRQGKPPVLVDYSRVGESPMGVSDSIVADAVKAVLMPHAE